MLFKKSSVITILSAFVFVSSAYAGKVELTTYYPAPYGEYKNLKSTEDSSFATTSGKVGIGTTTPSYDLEVIGHGASSIVGVGGYFDIRQDNTTKDVIIYSHNNASSIDIITRDGGSVYWDTLFLKNGNVGIGTTSVGTYKLTLNGQPGANGYTAWTNYSDRRLKENIKGIEDGTLEKIMELKPTTFNYNDKYFEVTGYSREINAPKLCGFVAQELVEVFPEMVNEKELSGERYMDTNLSNLQIYLVKAIQEQQKEIKLLKEEIAELKKK